ncbi:MAG: NAD(P)/FAD-dependent oxidoreductase [Cyanobacteria bacterium P01_E01_bin.35]
MVKKTVIIGAGPSGLLLAHYLLKRDRQYQVDIYERRPDPRAISVARSRTFPIALNERGMDAISQIPGLEAAVTAISVKMQGTIIHGRNGKQRHIPRQKSLTTLDRTELTKVFLDTLEQQNYGDRLKLNFNHDCRQVDLTARQVRFTNSDSEPFVSTVDYDLIIGADGAHSRVRKSFLDTKLFEIEQKYINNDYKSIFLATGDDPQSQKILESGKIHTWRLKDGTVIILLHQFDGSMAGVIHFPRDNNQIVKLKNATEAWQFFKQNFSEVGELISASEAAAFFARPVATTLTIRCNRYHYDDSALLIGDAAHAVSPALGQGCNSALEDVKILGQLLDRYGDDLSLVLEEFTKSRLADAHAVVELSNHTLPFAQSLFIELIVRQRLAKLLHRLFPQRFLPPLFDALNESSIPYAKIFHKYESWCNKVKKSKSEFSSAI